MSMLRSPMLWVAVGAVALSWALTCGVRGYFRNHGLMDVPNERSSHIAVTPRGGGVAIFITANLAWLVLWRLGWMRPDLLQALTVGGTAVALVGFLDDRRKVAPGVRLAVHAGAAVWALACLGGLPPLRIGQTVIDLAWGGHVLAVLAIVWAVNLFNFMDGIDGIAGTEAIFIAASAALLGSMGGWSGPGAGGLALAGACLGFLAWNWPPAMIFMGDVGSGYLGYAIAVMALSSSGDNPGAIWVWLILGGVFFIDATLTLIRRALRGEQVHQAHRSHAYQHLVRRWHSHRSVTLGVLLLNLAWLLPCAMAATLLPSRAVWIAIGALVPLLIGAAFAGSGRPESPAA